MKRKIPKNLLLCEFLSGVHIRILRPLKSQFQLFQLFASEGGSTSALFPLERDARFAFRIGVIAATST